MTVTYCTSADIAKFIHRNGDGSDFTSETHPTDGFVEDLINMVEDEIDASTHHAWRAIQVTNEYYHVRLAENPRLAFIREVPVFLRNREINTLVSGTDKIEVWTGSSYNDLVLDANGYTEGRGDDYWVDYTDGIVYFIDQRPRYYKNGVRMSYKYGGSSVPNDVKMACMMMVAVKLAYQDDRSSLFPEGGENIPLRQKVELWTDEASKILKRREEHILI